MLSKRKFTISTDSETWLKTLHRLFFFFFFFLLMCPHPTHNQMRSFCQTLFYFWAVWIEKLRRGGAVQRGGGEEACLPPLFYQDGPNGIWQRRTTPLPLTVRPSRSLAAGSSMKPKTGGVCNSARHCCVRVNTVITVDHISSTTFQKCYRLHTSFPSFSEKVIYYFLLQAYNLKCVFPSQNISDCDPLSACSSLCVSKAILYLKQKKI